MQGRSSFWDDKVACRDRFGYATALFGDCKLGEPFQLNLNGFPD